MRTERRARVFDALERTTELPMLVLAVAMVPLLAAPLVLDLDDRTESVVVGIDWMIWALFAVELAAKTYLAPSRRRYLTSHWYDVMIVVIPFLRPLRIARSARALRLLRLARLATFAVRTVSTWRAVLRHHGLQYVLLFATIAVFMAALVVMLAERQGGGSITRLDTALWWAVVTVTTVGYGDTFPVTALGRGIAVFLMLVGIGTFGLITASVAAFFVQGDDREVTNEQLLDELQQIHRRIDALEQQR